VGLSETQREHLLNTYQRNLPLVRRPFLVLADELRVSETEVLAALQKAQEEGQVSRVGPVFAPGRAGASTLAALAVPPAELEGVAALVSAYPEVNHNYAREHRYNLWFVVTAVDARHLQEVLAELRSRTGLPMLDLPMLEGFHIDLGFDLRNGERAAVRIDGAPGQPDALSLEQRALLGALQGGLPLVAEPFAAIAESLRRKEAEVRDQIAKWLESGLVKRFGIIVRHHELGFAANAMVVWNIPDARVRAAGQALAALPWITLCYRRPRRLPDWPYNLFCMIHGRDRDAVQGQVEEGQQRCGLEGIEHEVLFSTRRFKQRGAVYQPRAPIHG